MNITSVKPNTQYRLKRTERTANDGKAWNTIQLLGFGRCWRARGTYAVLEQEDIIIETRVIDRDNKVITGVIIEGADVSAVGYTLNPYVRKTDGKSRNNVGGWDDVTWVNNKLDPESISGLYECIDNRSRTYEETKQIHGDEFAELYHGFVYVTVTAQMLEKINF